MEICAVSWNEAWDGQVYRGWILKARSQKRMTFAGRSIEVESGKYNKSQGLSPG